MLTKIFDTIENFFRGFILPLYGRKMLIAIYAIVMYLLGVPWEQLDKGVQFVLDNNVYFAEAMWCWGILMVFMGGQMIDQMSNKEDDFTKARSMPVLEYLSKKTIDMFQPRAFLGWLTVAVLFFFNLIDAEVLFYVSMTYVGINSAEALSDKIQSVTSGMKSVLTNNAPNQLK